MRETEEVRKELDKRGVEWWEGWHKDMTIFDGAGGVRYEIDCMLGCPEIRSMLPITVEQAVSATLGTWACKVRKDVVPISMTQRHVSFVCDCGERLGGYDLAEIPWPHKYNESELPKHCPNCGRRIEVESD